MLGSWYCNVRRQSPACHRGGPSSIPGQSVWIVVEQVALDQAFVRIFSAFLFSVSFHQCSVLIKTTCVMFETSHSWFMYCDTFIQGVSLCTRTQLFTLSLSDHDSNGRGSGCAHLSALQLMWCFYCPFLQKRWKCFEVWVVPLSCLCADRCLTLVSKCVQHSVVGS